MRVHEVYMDGISVRIAPLTFDETEQYIEENRASAKHTHREWTERSLETVCRALNKAAGREAWTIERIKSELDLAFFLYLHEQILNKSGLITVAPEEDHDVDFAFIRCRIVTELGMTPNEVGAMDFPFVQELLEYWLDYPPAHVLLRAQVGYDPKKQNWREHRANEVGDESYAPERKSIASRHSSSAEEVRMAMNSFTGARHLDCAPGHIQEAVARAKRGDHLNVP
jgi:hypothetical protein